MQTKIRTYENFIRNIVNSIVQRIDFNTILSFRSTIKTKLKFESDNGWQFLTSSLDIIGDSQEAITEYINNNDYSDIYNAGEKYLKLYGVLSAIYIQQQAILELVRLFKVNGLKKIQSEFKNLTITDLRHYISAHPINYENNNGEKCSFKVARYSLWDKGNIIVRNQENRPTTYNLNDAINEYMKVAENKMEEISRKIVSTIYSTAKVKQQELIGNIENIKNSN